MEEEHSVRHFSVPNVASVSEHCVDFVDRGRVKAEYGKARTFLVHNFCSFFSVRKV